MSKTVLEKKYVVESVVIESFRGYNKQHSFTFKDPVTVFYGKNGQGKSSTLYAIEWCLFGEIKFLSPDGRARDEVINQFNPEGVASVKIILRNGKDAIELERTKETGKASTNFVIKTHDGQFEDEEAKKELFKISGMTIDDFIRSVYLHQEAIRALLTEEKKTRDEALDRLFGLEKIRNIMNAIPIKDVKDTIKELQKKKDSFGQKITGAIELCNSNIEKFKRKALDTGLSENDLNQEYATKNAKLIGQEIHALSTDYTLPKFEIELPSSLLDFGTYESKVKKALKEMQQANVDLDKISKLSTKKRVLRDLTDEIKNREAPIAESQAQIKDIVDKEGNLEKISNNLKMTETELEVKKQERNALDMNSKLIEDALQSLKILTKPSCPVCDNNIDIQKTIKKLEKQSESIVGNQIKEIDSKISELKVRVETLEGIQSKLSKYSEQLKKEEKLENEALSKLSDELGITNQDKSNIMSSAEKQIQINNDEIEKLEKSAQDQTNRVEKIRESLDLIGKVMDVLNEEEKLGGLRTLNPEESKEVDSIEKAIGGLHDFEDKLTKIINVSGKVQAELASQMIIESQRDIENYYTKLCMHQHYDKLKIDVEPSERGGQVKNAYTIRATNMKNGNETQVVTRFSTGQMNCVALSVFFALTKSLPVKLGFLLLDDPSQNLDSDHKDALADLLDLISKDRQIFISTQDEEFKKILQSKHSSIKFHEFVGWDALGPKFN